MTRMLALTCVAILLTVGLNVLFASAAGLVMRCFRAPITRASLRTREHALLASLFLPALFADALAGYTMIGALRCDDVARETWLLGPCVHMARHLCLHLDEFGLQWLAAFEVGEVAVIASLALLVGIAVRLRRVHSRGWTLKPMSRKLRQAIAYAEPAAGPVEVYQTDHCASGAAVIGWLRPRCVVAGWLVRRLRPAELTAALRHELAHVSRRDNLVRLLARLCRLSALCFPTTTILFAEWEKVAELRCDERAARTPDEALALASALVKALRHARGESRFALALLTRGESFALTRIERLVHFGIRGDDEQRTRRDAVFSLCLAMLLAALSISLAATLHCLAETLVRMTAA